jgi:4a-hydroxytetrahydrobiopterin dehydratase
MTIAKLSSEQIQQQLSKHPHWSLVADKLRRELVFKDFVEAFGFMSSVAMIAERSDHHPEWTNVSNRLTIELTTHDCGGLSARDFELAAAIDALHLRLK